MSISLNSIRRGKIQIKALRALLGMRGHRPSQFNINVGNCMKGQPGPHQGGRWDSSFQARFVDCCRKAGARVGAK